MWYLAAFTALALPAAIVAQQGRDCGGLLRNRYNCDINRFSEEVCVRQQNTLSQIMDCVVTKDPWLCTDSLSGQNFVTLLSYHPRGVDCVNPYAILKNGHLDVNCLNCSIYGILKLCIENLDGDDFRSCVCHHSQAPGAWRCLNKCFWQPHGVSPFNMQCDNGLWRKRGESERVYERIPEGVNKTATFDPSSPLVNDSGTLNVKRQNDAGDPNNPDPYQVIVSGPRADTVGTKLLFDRLVNLLSFSTFRTMPATSSKLTTTASRITLTVSLDCPSPTTSSCFSTIPSSRGATSCSSPPTCSACVGSSRTALTITPSSTRAHIRTPITAASSTTATSTCRYRPRAPRRL